MLPEVEAYFESTQKAMDAFNKARRERENSYDFDEDKYRADLAAARKELAEKTEDPCVKWLCTEPRIARSYMGQAETVLKAWPMTLNQLDDLANRHDWCGDYNSMRALAIAAGALTVEFKVQMRYPGQDWQNYRPLPMEGGTITHKDMGALLMKGINVASFEMSNGGMYFFRLDPESGQPRRRR